MRWVARLRMLLARRAWLYWLIVVALAATAGVAMTAATLDVRRERDAWGESAPVFVAARDIGPGEPLGDATVAADLPRAMLPPSAVDTIPDGAIATQHIAKGETIVSADLSSARAPLALLPDGWLAIEIPTADMGVASGAMGGPALFGVGDTATLLADGDEVAATAIIVQVTTAAVAVAVPRADAPRVAEAASRHVAVIALGRGGG
jgi:hypothetical protein